MGVVRTAFFVLGGGLLVTHSLIRSLISCFSGSLSSGNPSTSAGVSIFLVVARARCNSSETSSGVIMIQDFEVGNRARGKLLLCFWWGICNYFVGSYSVIHIFSFRGGMNSLASHAP